MSSRIRTKLMVKNKIIHSVGVKPNKNAAIKTKTATAVWILKFGSLLKASLMPERANLTLPPNVTFLLIEFIIHKL